MEKQRPVTLEADQIQFNVYSAAEIKQMSVCKITSSISFDSIGNPVSGGLYDVAMGPSSRREICSTCLKDQVNTFGNMKITVYKRFFLLNSKIASVTLDTSS